MTKSAISIRSPLIKTGIFAVATSLVLALVAQQLGGFTFDKTASYGAVFTDVSGLKSGDPVMISGVQVGQVSDITISDNVQAKVSFDLRDGRTVPRNVTAVVRYKDLTGDRYLELRRGPGDAPPLAVGAALPVSQTQPALDLDTLLAGLNPLFEGLQPDQVNQLSGELVSVLQGEGGTIDSVLDRLASFTSTMADKDRVIGEVVQNLNSVLGNLDVHKTQLSDTITGLQQLVTGLADQHSRIGQSFVQADNLVGSLNGLLVDLRQPFAGMVDELGRTATIANEGQQTIDDVLRTLPGAYLRIGRLGSRGAGYNLYLCSLRVRLTGSDGQPIYTPWLGPSENIQRCKPGVAPLETPEQREHDEQAGLPVGTK